MEGIKIGDKIFSKKELQNVVDVIGDIYKNNQTREEIIEVFKQKYYKWKNIRWGIIDAFDEAIFEVKKALKEHKNNILYVKFVNQDVKNAFWEMYFKWYKRR